jgi:hypothetical protein
MLSGKMIENKKGRDSNKFEKLPFSALINRGQSTLPSYCSKPFDVVNRWLPIYSFKSSLQLRKPVP